LLAVREELGAECQDERLSGAGDAAHDPVAFAENARHLFLVQVHDGERAVVMGWRLPL
jgi:hypothetical protein